MSSSRTTSTSPSSRSPTAASPPGSCGRRAPPAREPEPEEPGTWFTYMARLPAAKRATPYALPALLAGEQDDGQAGGHQRPPRARQRGEIGQEADRRRAEQPGPVGHGGHGGDGLSGVLPRARLA